MNRRDGAAPKKSEACPLCGGSGWQTGPREGGLPVARACSCRAAVRLDRMLATARIPERYIHCEIDNFECVAHPLKAVRKKVESYIEDFPLNDYGLLFTGNCGTGKTHLAIGILKEAIRRYRVKGIFYDFRDLLNEIRSSYNEVSQSSEQAVLSPVLTADLLVLDDLGAEKTSAWVQDTLSFIINHRYNHKKRCIITTNYLDPPPEASPQAKETFTERIGARLRSRLHEMCDKIEFQGDDFRRRIKGPGIMASKTPLKGPRT